MNVVTADMQHFNYGKNNPSYKDRDATYGAIHAWIRRRKPKPVRCELCGEIKDTEVVLRGEKYTRNIYDYWYLCRRCHMLIDGRTEKAIAYGKNIKRENINCVNCGTGFHPKKQNSKFHNLPCYREWNRGEKHWHHTKGGDAHVR